ncbi:MAG: hypothetical protein JNK15_22495 [Planctomycetes bacterium]|nr:hypothetical protein [Planctomycetota bacterium]
MKAPGPDHGTVARLADKVLAALDWRALGDVYFHDDGERLLRAKRRDIAALGERLARALLPRLPRQGASLWVGAGLAELPVLLAEVLLTARTVVAANLRADECRLLDAAVQAAAPGVALRFVPEDAVAVAPGQTFDHLGCISVFTDPETWPMLSGVAYGRIAPVQVDVDAFVAERERARGLAGGLFARLVRPGLVTTTAEEVSWFLEQAEAGGAIVEPSDEMIDTAVVGDPVGFLAVRPAAAG